MILGYIILLCELGSFLAFSLLLEFVQFFLKVLAQVGNVVQRIIGLEGSASKLYHQPVVGSYI